MDDVLQVIERRSSTRGYTEQKLSGEELERLILAGLQAPTAANRQEVHISVVEGDNPVLQEIETVKSFYWGAVDAGIAVENISLAAEGMGLGSLIIGCIKDALSGEKKEYFANALKFPEGYAYQIAIAIGHKAVGKKPHEYSVERNVSYV